MPKTAFITGITGQDGSYLAEFLLSQNYTVIGLTRRSSTVGFERLAGIQEKITIVQGDLLDQSSLSDIIAEYRPDEVYNLGGQSIVGMSWSQPVLDTEATGVGVTRLLEAIRTEHPTARYYQASSSEMFGEPLEVPQSETTPFNPRNPYGVAKVYGHWMTKIYRKYHGMYAVSGILYNHESPRRGREFVPRKITHGAASIRLGLTSELRLGNLDAQRDWGFAGDYVRAMWMMLQNDEPEDFLIASGETHSVREICDIAFSYLGLDASEHLLSDAKFARPAEVAQLVGNPSKAREKLGWTPEVTFKELIERMAQADLDFLKSEDGS